MMYTEKIKLKIMDDLLAEGVHIPNPEAFTKLINQNLPLGERKIKAEQTKKLLNELRALVKTKGIALIHGRGSGYRYHRKDFRFFDDRISEDEKNLLLIANSLFSVFPGSGMNEQFSFVVNKILKKQNRRGELQGLENFNPVQLGPMQKDSGSKWLPKIVKAMMESDFALEVEYEKPKELPTIRVLSPYIIKQYASAWYLVAFDHNTSHKDKTKVFKLSRIKNLELSGNKFKRDSDFSAEDYFKYTIGILHSHLQKPVKVEIQILTDSLFQICQEAPLHISQIIKDASNKVIQIEAYNTEELYTLLLKYGSAIKVLSPSVVAKELKSRLISASKLY